MPMPSTQLETEETIASTTETTPMVNQAIEEQPVSQSTYKNTNSIISGFPMLSRIRRTIANAQAAVPSSTDGVFSNLSAKPESETEKEDENPPVGCVSTAISIYRQTVCVAIFGLYLHLCYHFFHPN